MLDMSLITQGGDSALMRAAYCGRTNAVVELINSGANLDLQNEVCPGTVSYVIQ